MSADEEIAAGEQALGQLDYDSALLLTIAKYFTPSGRLIQRDYSNGGFYNYYYPGGLAADRNKQSNPQNGPESHTDTGRAVYGGGVGCQYAASGGCGCGG